MSNQMASYSKSRVAKLITIVFVMLSTKLVFSQSPITAYVISPTVNVRTGPSVTFDTVCTLRKGSKVEIVGKIETDEKQRLWYPVEIADANGYYLYGGWIVGQYLKINSTEGWNPTSSYTGSTPECSNIDPQYEYSMKNKLQIDVNGGTDCIVKLYNSYDVCIRIAYIRSGESYAMEFIPEGVCHLKIAYGNDYRKKIYSGNCYVKFMNNAQYQTGEEELDFRRSYSKKYEYGKEYNVTSFPSFRLSLSVAQSTGNHFDTDAISESEFNR